MVRADVQNPVGATLVATACRTPGRLAVRDEQGELTYEELDALAGTFARVLLEHVGGDPGTGPPVPLMTGMNRWSVVAMHGATRAGVPYVPVGPDLPPEAIDDLLGRLGHPPFVVVDPANPPSLPGATGVLELGLRADDPIPPRPLPADDLACVLFTSGSTGRPKGVVYEWANVADRLADALRMYDGSEHEHLGVVTPLHWLAGYARVVGVACGHSITLQPSTVRDPVRLLEWLDREAVTVIPVVPSVAAQVVGRWPSGRRLEHVHRVRTFGEPLLWEHVPGLRDLVPDDAVVEVVYTSSEAVIALYELRIRRGDPLGSGRVPVGYEIVPGRVRLEPVDDDPGGDAPAEIVVVGRVARGYWDDPELNAARFGREPDGTRMWRSGDLARVDEQGRVVLVGRTDDLVKIRGKLVEPSEPERVLMAIDGIREAVVLPYEGERGTRLVAHLVLEPETELTPAEVRATLAAQLAPHLVPSPMVVYEHLPVNASNKVDRVVLRTVPLDPWRTAAPRRPRDELEADVTIVCAQVLELDEVGPDDDLWELGLDSFAAIELAEDCSQLGWGPFDPTTPLACVTPAAIADVLRSAALARDTRRPSTLIDLNPGGTRAPIVAFPGAGGTALAFHWLARAVGPDQPFSVVEPVGLHTPGRPDRTIADAARRGTDTVAARWPDGPVTLLGHSAGGAIAYEAARRLRGQGRDVRVVLVDARLAGVGASPPLVVGAGSTGPSPSPSSSPGLLRGRTAGQLAARVTEELRVRYRVLRPGPPSGDLARFKAFERIGRRALRAYEPGPPTFPVVLLHVDDLGPASWHRYVPDLACERIPGAHLSLLRPPHVARVADLVAEFHAVTPAP